MPKVKLSQEIILEKVQSLINEMIGVKKTFKPLDERQAKIIRGRVIGAYLKEIGIKKANPHNYNLHMAICELYIRGYSLSTPTLQQSYIKRILCKGGYLDNIARCRMSNTELGVVVRRYNTAFKLETVEFYLNGNTVADTLRNYGVKYETLRDWVQKYELGKFKLNDATGFSLR